MRLIQDGSRKARIMLVGEAPGWREWQTGKPFAGGAGDMLDRMLSRVGISRSDCFLTNVCHEQAPGGKFENFMQKQHQPAFIRGLLQLKADIEAIRPNVVVALGAHPLRVLTGKTGIDKWRGSILESTLVKGQKVIGTYNPAYILKVYDYKAVAEMDLLRVRDDSKFPELNLPEREYILDPDPLTMERVTEEMLQAEWLGVDIECAQDETGTWKLVCVGFSDHAGRAMVLPYKTYQQKDCIRRLCVCPAKKVFQNGMFDVTVLEVDENIAVTNFAWDTMLAHHSLYTECASGSDEISAMGKKKRQAAIAKGLGFLTSINTREPYFKDDGKVWKIDGDIMQFYLYNGKDTAVTREIRDVQAIDLEASGLMPVFQHAMSLVRPLLTAMWRGIRIDLEKRDRVKGEYEEQIGRLQTLLDHLAGGHLNVKSPPQVKAFLYDKLGLPPQIKRKTGNISGDKDAIVAIADKTNNPAPRTILEVRERRDLLERYIAVPLDADGRMRTSIDITGTASGRLASRVSIRGTGSNLQNIPTRKAIGQKIKSYFIPDKGKIFVQRDYKQAEAVCVAYESECEGLIELFNDPTRDVHFENAARIFEKPVDVITDEERYLSKRVVHASNYGMAAFRLAQLVNQDAALTGVSLNTYQAQKLIDMYFMIYPEIKEIFWADVERELRHSRSLTNAFGRKRIFFGRWDDELLRTAYSYRPQSTVGDLTCKAVVRAYHEVELAHPEWGAEFLMTVHDSILFQCNEGCEAYVAAAMREAMKIPITIRGRTFMIDSDCEVGMNWSKKSKDNPDGLTKYKDVV